MGKNKGLQATKKNRNVFKVATVRSVKLKTRAQKVVINLKDLDSKITMESTYSKYEMRKLERELQEVIKEGTLFKSKVKTNNVEQGKQKNVQNVARVQVGQVTSDLAKMQV